MPQQGKYPHETEKKEFNIDTALGGMRSRLDRYEERLGKVEKWHTPKNPKKNADVITIFILGSELEELLEKYQKDNPVKLEDVNSANYSKLRSFIEWIYKNGYEIREKK